MKKIEHSFYNEIFDCFKTKNFSKINQFIKNNLWLTPLVYIIGTIALLIRNKMFGLQYTSISLLQFSLIVVYLIIFLVMYSCIEFNFIVLFDLINKKDESKVTKIVGHIILFLLYFLMVYCFMYILIDDTNVTIKLVLSYFILWPIFLIFLNNNDKLSNLVTILFFITLIMNIPISLGGFKGQDVIYYDYNTNEKIEYIYYGNYDGLYQFVLKDKVILIPIDSGYIEYTK